MGTWRERRRLARCRGRLGHDPAPGEPVERDGRALVAYHCAECGTRWTRPVEQDIGEEDVVRVDLPDRTVYGWVASVDGDRITMTDSATRTRHTADRWRVRVY
ncbi:hypothetical protein [Streptomyces sp. NPDC049881]|uniref:hypothetical protein n=1 Tax=unclassified Streptomyces TaxID=2593676 RepID=UPI0034221C50